MMVCHAFGIPAIGVGQPAHACVAYKAVNPLTQPQPGSAWKVGYGRGWEFSKLMGLRGPDFLAGVEDRRRFWRSSPRWSACDGWPRRWLPANGPQRSWASPIRSRVRPAK